MRPFSSTSASAALPDPEVGFDRLLSHRVLRPCDSSDLPAQSSAFYSNRPPTFGGGFFLYGEFEGGAPYSQVGH